MIMTGQSVVSKIISDDLQGAWRCILMLHAGYALNFVYLRCVYISHIIEH